MSEGIPPYALRTSSSEDGVVRHRLAVICVHSNTTFLTAAGFTAEEIRSLGPIPCPRCGHMHKLISMKRAIAEGLFVGIKPEYGGILMTIGEGALSPDELLPAPVESISVPFTSLLNLPDGARPANSRKKSPGPLHPARRRRRKR